MIFVVNRLNNLSLKHDEYVFTSPAKFCNWLNTHLAGFNVHFNSEAKDLSTLHIEQFEEIREASIAAENLMPIPEISGPAIQHSNSIADYKAEVINDLRAGASVYSICKRYKLNKTPVFRIAKLLKEGKFG